MIIKKIKIEYLLVIMAFVGSIIMFFTTKQGIGLSPDSAAYITAARNLLSNKTLLMFTGNSETLVPMTHFPPLYPIILATSTIINIDPLIFSRWLNILLFSINIFLVGFIIHRQTKSAGMALFGSALMLSSFDIITIHSMAWSEPLFIFLTLLTFIFLIKYFNENKIHLLLIASFISGLAFLTRYVGITLVATGIISLLLFENKNLFIRIKKSLYFGIIGCLPILIWIIRNMMVAQTATNRNFVFHPLKYHHLESLMGTLFMWIISSNIIIQFILMILISVIISWLIIYLHKKNIKTNEPVNNKSLYLFIIFIVLYLCLLIVSISFFDAATPLDNRILSPIMVGLIIYLISMTQSYLYRLNLHKDAIIKLTCIIFVFIYIFNHLLLSIPLILQSYKKGIGYNSAELKQSNIIKIIKQLPENTLIYTNQPSIILMITKKNSYFIPRKASSLTLADNTDLAKNLSDMTNKIKTKNGYFIYFDNSFRWYEISKDEILKSNSLSLVYQDEIGSIYQYNNK